MFLMSMMNGRQLKAQASLEYLLLGLVSIAMLGVSLGALGSIRQNADESYEKLLFQKESTRLAQTAEELCILGSGNAREIELKEKLIINYENGKMVIERGAYRQERELLCEIGSMELEGRVILENRDGKIVKKE